MPPPGPSRDAIRIPSAGSSEGQALGTVRLLVRGSLPTVALLLLPPARRDAKRALARRRSGLGRV